MKSQVVRAVSPNKGFTLIELLVYMVIATSMISAGIMLFKNSGAQRNAIAGEAELYQESFTASHILSQQFAQIGYRQIDKTIASGRVMPLETKDAAFPEVTNEWLTGQVIKGTADSLAFRFQGASRNDLSADETIYDCSGNPVPAGIIRAALLSFENNQLHCTTEGQTNILAGINDTIDIERVLFELGVDDNGDGAVDRRIPSSTSTDTDFINTRQITARLLLATADQAASTTQNFRFNNQEEIPTDRKLRLETEITVMLRN